MKLYENTVLTEKYKDNIKIHTKKKDNQLLD